LVIEGGNVPFFPQSDSDFFKGSLVF